MSVKRIGILTSGGDAPGMNPCVRAVVRTAIYHGIECYGIRRGYQGLIIGDVVKLDEKSVNHTINRGGTILYSARSKEFMTEEGQKKAVSTCKFLGLDSIIAIGGDGTFRGAQALSKFGVNVIGIPATIDNDIGCTHYCLGFDTAANTAIECIDKLRDTMQSHERCSVVEVMGRNAGYLAMYVGLAVGATAVLVPENPFDFERDVIEKIRQARLNGFTHYMIVVAEGASPATEIARVIKEATDMDPRVTVLGHIQRGGVPTGRDRVNATKMGYMAVELETEALAKDQKVTVRRADGAELEGTVESSLGGKAVVLVTDNGPQFDEEVTISLEGTQVGKGKLYIHNPLSVTGFVAPSAR